MSRKRWVSILLSVCMVFTCVLQPCVGAASAVFTQAPGGATVTIEGVTATPYIKMDGADYIQETKLSLTNTGVDFTANVKITVETGAGTKLAYETKNMEIKTGKYELVRDEKGETVSDTSLTVYAPDTHELLKPEDVATMTLEIYDAASPTGAPVATGSDTQWKRTRHWQFYMSQKMHMDIGFNHTPWELPRDYSEDVLDLAKSLVKTYGEGGTNESAVPYRYSIESSYMLTNAYMAKKSYTELQELVGFIKDGGMNVGAGWSNYTMEDFNTEENARAAYKTNRTLVDQLGIEPGKVQYMFDNPAYSKSYVDAAAKAGIKYGIHAMNVDRSPYNQKKLFDLFYMQGNDPDNKFLVFNEAHYGTRYGFYFANEKDYQTDTAKRDLTKLMNDLEARGVDSVPPFYPYDLFPLPLVMQGDNQPPNKSQSIIADMLSKEWAGEGYVFPALKSALPEEFFEDVVEQYGDYIPTRTGTEENWWNDGWATTAYDSGVMKQAGSVLPVAETTASLNTALNGAKYPIDEVSAAWDRNLIFDEHTWGWRGIADIDKYTNCYEWKRSNAFATRDLASSVLDDSLQGLANDVGIVGDQAIYVYNSLNWLRDDTVALDDLSNLPEYFEILDGATSVPYTIAGGKLTFVAKDVPAMGYKTYTVSEVQEAPDFTAPSDIERGQDYIQNEYYKVTFNYDGTIKSILDRKNGGKELVDSSADVKFNQYQYYDDHGFPQNPSTSFKVTPDKWTLYQPKAEDTAIEIEENGISATATVQTSTFRASEIRQSVTLYGNMPRIDIENVVLKGTIGDLNKKEEAFYTFPFASSGDYEICYDLPQGNQVEGEQIYGTSTDFYTASKWVNVKDKGASDYNMAIALPNTSLLMFGERRTGQWSFDYHSKKPYIYSYVMNNQWWTNFQYDQPGLANFNYSISTNSDAGYGKTAHFAWEVCTPLQARIIEGGGAGTGAASGSYVGIDQNNVILTTMKPSESNADGFILRFYEMEGKNTASVAVTLPSSLSVSAVNETDIIENDLVDGDMAVTANGFTFSMKPYTMKTFRVKFGSAPAAPAAVSATSITAPAAGTKVTWDVVPGASHYEVFRGTDAGFTPAGGSGHYVGSTADASIFDPLAKGAGTFYYRVRAASGGAKSAYSAAVQAVSSADADTTAPDRPILTGQANSSTRIDLSWTPVRDDVMLSKYEVWRAVGVDTDLNHFARIFTTPDNWMSTYRDTELSGGKTFTYFVKAIDTAGNAVNSDLVTLSAYEGGEVTQKLWLDGLDVSPCTIAPCFDAETYEYNLNFGQELQRQGHITVTPALPEGIKGATITVNGTTLGNGESLYVPIYEVGDEVAVTISKGTSEQTYLLRATENEPILSIDPMLIPGDTTTRYGTHIAAGSTNGAGTVVTHLVDGSGMSGSTSVSDTHDNDSGAATMWHTGKSLGAGQNWVMVDLGGVFDLDKLYIWNLNQYNPSSAGLTGRGLKNISVSYSSDGNCWLTPDEGRWIKLPAPQDIVYGDTTNAVSEVYPFQLAKGTEVPDMAATNLNDGNNTPISFGGESVRYVMIRWEIGANKGNWGDSVRYGLSEIRFTGKMSFSEVISMEISAVDGATGISDVSGQLQMIAAVNPEATNRNVTWTVDSDRATISRDGVLTARKNGTVTVTATTVDGSNLSDTYVLTIENQPEVIEIDAVRAGSEAVGHPAVNVINNSGMSASGSIGDLHDDAEDTSWSTEAGTAGSNAWIEFDLGKFYNVEQMWVWNFNQAGSADSGMQNIKIEYRRSDTEPWKELRTTASGSEYPYTLEKAAGKGGLHATNLVGGAPVEFGVVARYVRLTADPQAELGSYLGDAYGLSEVRFTKGEDIPDGGIPVTGVLLDRTELSMMLGSAGKLNASIIPANAIYQEVTWSSSDESIVAVDADGKLTAVAEGTASVTVTTADGNKTASCTVTVTPAESLVKTGAIRHTEIAGTEGEANKIYYAGSGWQVDEAGHYCGPDQNPDDGSQYYSITFTGQQFKLYAKKYKNVGIAAVCIDGGLEAEFDLYENVASAQGKVQMVYESPLLSTGVHTVRGVLTGKPGVDSATGKANMDFSYAEIFGVSSGDTIPATGVILNKGSLRLALGGSELLTATVQPTDATERAVTWSSDNEAVATVTGGLVRAVAEGDTVITVTTKDGGFTAACYVKVSREPAVTTEYTITVTRSEHGVIAPDTKKVQEGENQTFAITADSGYEIKDVLVDGESVGAVSAYTFEDVQADHTLCAEFAQKSTPPPAGGTSAPTRYTITVTQSEGGSIAPASASVKRNESAAFTIKAAKGYVLKDVLVDGESVGAVSSYTFEKVTQRHRITAIFEVITEPEKRATDFADVQPSDWFVDAVQWALDEGLMNGTSNNTFAPMDKTSRAMVLTMLYRRAGSPDGTDSGTWYDAAAKWAMATGVSDGANLTAEITREQLVTMLWRVSGSPKAGLESLEGFTDGKAVSDWAREAMAWAAEKGILTGKTQNGLDPAGEATRAETATMFMRLTELA